MSGGAACGAAGSHAPGTGAPPKRGEPCAGSGKAPQSSDACPRPSASVRLSVVCAAGRRSRLETNPLRCRDGWHQRPKYVLHGLLHVGQAELMVGEALFKFLQQPVILRVP